MRTFLIIWAVGAAAIAIIVMAYNIKDLKKIHKNPKFWATFLAIILGSWVSVITIAVAILKSVSDENE